MVRAAAWCAAKTRRRLARSTVAELTSNADLTTVRKALQRRKALVDHTIYECGQCGDRFVGVDRVPAAL